MTAFKAFNGQEYLSLLLILGPVDWMLCNVFMCLHTFRVAAIFICMVTVLQDHFVSHINSLDSEGLEFSLNFWYVFLEAGECVTSPTQTWLRCLCVTVIMQGKFNVSPCNFSKTWQAITAFIFFLWFLNKWKTVGKKRKWTAPFRCQHINLCLLGLVPVFGLDYF